MSEPKKRRGAHRLATAAYVPHRVRPLPARAAILMLTCAGSLLTGAAAATWHARTHANAEQPCEQPPSDAELQAELTRARVTLDKEIAARAALQELADAHAGKASQLEADLRFLRAQQRRQ